MANYIIHTRQNKILYSELIIASLLSAILLVSYFKLHLALGLLIGIANMILLAVLFVRSRIFRYVFSILFSFCWAVCAHLLGLSIDKKSHTTGWVLAIIVFALSLWAHWDHFTFLRNAKKYEYERH
jgi:hypothetical protein